MSSHGRCENNLTPLALAENLCVPCADEAVLNSRDKSPSQKVTKAWRLAELALASKDPEVKRKSLDVSHQLIARALGQKITRVSTNRANVLKGQLPAIQDRAYGLKPSAPSRKRANMAFGDILVNRYDAHAGNIGGSAEALVWYLMSREGVPSEDFLFVGSYREESSQGDNQRVNHDTYRLWPDAAGSPSKIPLQMKATQSSQYDVPVLVVGQVLSPVLNALGTDSLEPLMAMAGFESIGRGGSYQETMLDFAGHCIQTKITNLTYNAILTGFGEATIPKPGKR